MVITRAPPLRDSAYVGRNVYWSAAEVALVSQFTVVTVTSTVPVGSAGVMTTIEVPESLTIVPATLPKFTLVALLRFVPVTVTEVPPTEDPVVGLMPVTVGVPGAVPL